MTTSTLLAATGYIGIVLLDLCTGMVQAADITPNIVSGSGNADSSFTLGSGRFRGRDVTDHDATLKIGLRTKLRFDENILLSATYTYDGLDAYAFDAGAVPGGFSRDSNSVTAQNWCFDWSAATDSNLLFAVENNISFNALTYEMPIAGDAGAGIKFFTFDPINQTYWDHASSTMATATGPGIVAASPSTYADLLSKSSVARTSWKYELFKKQGSNFFMSPLAIVDPTETGKYRIGFEVFYNRTALTSAGINIVVNARPTAPSPAALPVMSAALGGIALLCVAIFELLYRLGKSKGRMRGPVAYYRAPFRTGSYPKPASQTK